MDYTDNEEASGQDDAPASSMKSLEIGDDNDDFRPLMQNGTADQEYDVSSGQRTTSRDVSVNKKCLCLCFLIMIIALALFHGNQDGASSKSEIQKKGQQQHSTTRDPDGHVIGTHVKIDPKNLPPDPSSRVRPHQDQPSNDIHYSGPPLPSLPDSCEPYRAVESSLSRLQLHHNASLRCDPPWLSNHGTCSCPEPVVSDLWSESSSESMKRKWHRAFARNQQLLQRQQDDTLDVLLLGDSITEHWLGTDLGRDNANYAASHIVYQELFRNNNNNSTIQGLALGIGGDRTSELLYRLRNGEHIPASVQVVWINIGTNDLSGHCNAPSTAWGIEAVVFEIQRQVQKYEKPPLIVVNSILPRGGYHGTADLRGNRGWAIAQRVNHQLWCFARGQPGVQFVDTTDLFVYNKNIRNITLYHDDVHPNELGYRVWGNFIVDFVHSWIQNRSETSSMLVPSPNTTIPLEENSLYNGPALPIIPESCDFYYHDYDLFIESFSDESAIRCDAARRSCGCTDPSVGVQAPYKGSMLALWEKSVFRNTLLLQPYQEDKHLPLDVLMLGDSITEHWLGTDLSVSYGDWKESYQVYQELFRRSKSLIHGLALGIGGDRTSQLLYRVQRGEVPIPSQTKVVWINIGTNNLADYCNAESIAAGTMAIVEAILSQFHGSQQAPTIVINSILPRGGGSGSGADLRRERGWQLARRANHRLKCYADQKEGVTYVDTSSLFVGIKDDLRQIRNASLYHDDVHPSAEGYRVWGAFIVEQVQDIIQTGRKG